MPLGSQQTFNNTRVEYVEDKEVCPYNKSHLIRPERMQQHLIKCRKDVLSKPTHPFHHEAKHMMTCPLNANHHVVKAELSRHLQNCSSRLELRKAEVEEGPPPEWRSAIPQGRTVEASEDDWGEEADANPHRESYNPERKVLESDSPYLYNIQGKSKSEKRNYRAEQRLKYGASQGGGGREQQDMPVGLNYRDQGSNGGWGETSNGWGEDWQERKPTLPVGLHVNKKNNKQGNGGGQIKQKGTGGQNAAGGTKGLANGTSGGKGWDHGTNGGKGWNNGTNGGKGWDNDWEEKTAGRLAAMNLPDDAIPFDSSDFPTLGGPRK